MAIEANVLRGTQAKTEEQDKPISDDGPTRRVRRKGERTGIRESATGRANGGGERCRRRRSEVQGRAGWLREDCDVVLRKRRSL
jgi:hypothetical protein